ncbi:polyhydroxyalkanoic acid synthase subunit PhaR [Neobacillus niacini]|uniref:polyhydroxyalkanoic acid synthase subunit PhaR n=1 Tax=Neobacillus niacini TaxID=86668 RepID=UPI002FFF62A0
MTLETNLFDIWKDYYAKSSSYFDETIKENFPSKGIAQVMEMNLMYKKLIDESTEKYLEIVNIPSRNDLANLSSLVVNVDAKVDNLEELLEDSSANQIDPSSFKQELAAIKKDMKNLDSKMNQILTLLKVSEGTK